MPISRHAAYLREHVGHATLLLPAVAAIVRDEAERILPIRRSDTGSWSLPGGMMEPGECITDCVVREVREETGLEVAYWAADSLPETIVPGHQICIQDALTGREAAFFR